MNTAGDATVEFDEGNLIVDARLIADGLGLEAAQFLT